MPHHHIGHHPPHPPHGHHGPVWIFSADGQIDRASFFDQVAEIAGELSDSGSTHLGETLVEVPERIRGTVRFERTPHGALALVFKAEWSDNDGAPDPVSSPITAVRSGNGAER